MTNPADDATVQARHLAEQIADGFYDYHPLGTLAMSNESCRPWLIEHVATVLAAATAAQEELQRVTDAVLDNRMLQLRRAQDRLTAQEAEIARLTDALREWQEAKRQWDKEGARLLPCDTMQTQRARLRAAEDALLALGASHDESR